MEEQVRVYGLENTISTACSLVRRFFSRHPEYTDRLEIDIDDTAALNKHMREYCIDSLIYEINDTAEYKVRQTDPIRHIRRLINGYTETPSYLIRGELIMEDQMSYDFEFEVLRRIERLVINKIFRSNIDVRKSVIDINVSGKKVCVKVYGDYRAKLWCEEQGVEYVP